MAEKHRFGILDVALLLTLLGAAGGARAGYLYNLADRASRPGPLQVQEDYTVDTLVARAQEETPHHAPGYPWLLALLQRAPVNLEPLDQTVRWIQCALGTLAVGFTFLFARRAFASRVVAGLAGVLAAVHPFWIVNTAELNDGVLTAFLLMACLYMGSRAGQAGGVWTSLVYGLSLAGLALVRAALLPFAFVGLLWFLYRCRGLRQGWFCALLAFLGFCNGLLPWTFRNYQVCGEVIPVVASTYAHLWLGNHPQATGGPQPEAIQEEARSQSRTELAEAVVRELRENPAGTLRRRLWAGLCFFFGESWLTNPNLWRDQLAGREEVPEGLPHWGPAWLQGSLLGMLVLGALGWRWSYGWRRAAMPAALALIWIPLPYLLSHAEALVGPRLPLDGVLLCYAAFALACCLPGLGGYLLRGAELADGK